MVCRARLSCRSPPRLSRCRVTCPDDAGIGLTPGQGGKGRLRADPASRHCCVRCGDGRTARLSTMSIRRPRPVPAPPSAFAGFRFPPEIIVLAVRWYLRFGLSYRDVEELLTERGVEVDHVSVYRWVLRFTPLLADAARPCRHAVGDRWWVDETYVKVAGR